MRAFTATAILSRNPWPTFFTSDTILDLLLGWVTCVDSSSSPFLFLLFKKFILFGKTLFWGQTYIQGHNLINKTLQEVFPVSLKCQVSSCITIWESGKNRYQDYASVI